MMRNCSYTTDGQRVNEKRSRVANPASTNRLASSTLVGRSLRKRQLAPCRSILKDQIQVDRQGSVSIGKG